MSIFLSTSIVFYILFSIVPTLARIIPLQDSAFIKGETRVFEEQKVPQIPIVRGIVDGKWYGPERRFGDHPLHVTLTQDEIFRPVMTPEPELGDLYLDTESGSRGDIFPTIYHSVLEGDELPIPLDSYEDDLLYQDAGVDGNGSSLENDQGGSSGPEDVLADRKFYIFYLNDSQKVVQEIDGKNFTVYLDFDEGDATHESTNGSDSQSADSYGPYIRKGDNGEGGDSQVTHPERIIIFGGHENWGDNDDVTTSERTTSPTPEREPVLIAQESFIPSDTLSGETIEVVETIDTNETTSPTLNASLVTSNSTSNTDDRELFESLPHHKAIQEKCMEPLVNNGTCGRLRFMWFYDLRANQCYEFIYRGCKGNGNLFPTKLECTTNCLIKDFEFVW